MTDGGAGGLIAMCLFIVGPIAMALHFASRRFFVVTLLVSAVFALFMFGLWVYFDAFVPERRWDSFPLVWMSFVLAFVVSVLAGVPAILVRIYLRRANKK